MDHLDNSVVDHADIIVARTAIDPRDNPPILPEYLNPKQAATLTGFTPKALERMRQRGDGPPFLKRGKSIRYTVADLRAWMEAGRVDHS